MSRIQRKPFIALQTGLSLWLPVNANKRDSMPPPAQDPSALSGEFLSWARWLDTLRDAARGGDYAAVQALAKGKLRFILRRCSLLRDKAMLGVLHHRQLTEAQALCQEFEQVIGELTGRIMPPADEWPLPVRFYAPEPAMTSTAGGLRGLHERRHVPARQKPAGCGEPIGSTAGLRLPTACTAPAAATGQSGRVASDGASKRDTGAYGKTGPSGWRAGHMTAGLSSLG